MLEIALLRGLVAALSYRCGLHGKLGVSTHEVDLQKGKHLPTSLVLAFASDFHAGPTTHPQIFTDLLDEVRKQRPDVLLLGGDYVSGSAKYVDALCDQLSQCSPRLGKYAVFGNHDLWADDAHIMRQLARAGVTTLVNRACALPAPFDDIFICGIDDPWTGSVDVESAFAGAGPIRIFLTHSPDGLLFLDQYVFDVGFAGHTHGGQIARRDGTPIVSAGGPLSLVYSRGRFAVAPNRPFFVSRGVGCSTVPIRINADPELIICTLRSDNQRNRDAP